MRPTRSLKLQPRAQPQLPFAERCRDLPERSGKAAAGIIEMRRVRQVECRCHHVQPKVLRKSERSREAHVVVAVSRTANGIAAHGTERSRKRLDERARVEP